MRFFGFLGDILGFYGIYWDFMGYIGFLWDILGFYGIYWVFMGYIVISLDILGFYGIYWDFVGFLCLLNTRFLMFFWFSVFCLRFINLIVHSAQIV